MKPNFALSLSFDGIRLLRRAYLGWHPVGDVGLDVPDLGAALADLREKAQEFAPAGMTTKLVIPSDQIKFLDIEQPDDWAENKDAILLAALENATPYDVSELVYDWSAQGGRVQIAAVARETLAEAEAFAAEHNFAPVSFVALPEDAQFAAEPFFGETSQAAEHMPRKAKVERDMGKIRVIPAPQPAAPAPDPAPEAEPEEDTQPGTSETASADEARHDAAPDTTASETAFTPAAAGEPAEDEAKGTAETAEAAPATSGKPSLDAAPEESPDAIAGDGTEGTASDDGASDEPMDVAAEDDADDADTVAPTPPPPSAAPEGTSVFAMAASAASATRPPDAEDAVLTNAQGPDAPAVSNGSDEDASGFATIRAKRDADAALAVPRLKGVSRLSGLAAAAAPGAGADVAPPPAMTDPPLTRGPSETPHRASNGVGHGTDKKADKKAGATNGTDRPADDVDAMFSLTPANGSVSRVSPPEIKAPDPAAMSPAETAANAAAAIKPDPEAVSEPEAAPEALPAAPPRLGFASRRAANPERASKGADRKRGKGSKGSATHAPAVEDEKQRMTVFGAREQQVGGKPRYLGLILTAVLLLFLVAVAAWASIFLDDGLARLFGGPKDTDVASAPGVTEDPIDEATGNLPTPNRVVTAAPSAEAAGLGSALDNEPLPDLARFISPDEALAQYAATGIWQMAPLPPDAPTSGQLDDLGVARDIPPVARPSLITLPAQLAALTDLPPARPGTQATPDIRLDVEPQTLITATPEGVLSADGVLIVAGRPEVEPPRVMTRADLPEGETPQAGTLAETPELGTPAADDPALAALAALRPRPRPEGAVPEGQADTTEDTPADDTADAADDAARDAATSELAALRPRLRPASVEAIAAERDAAAHRAEQEAATAAPDDASIQAALASASTAGLGNGIRRGSFDNPTPQAVTVSLTPKFRPRGLAAKARAAQEAAAARPVEASQVLAPSIPSSASVAKRATQRNVLHLRKVNLIGVYGSPSSRRALVRLPSGRYKKVKIGDRLDGGQVSAIGADELRYVKRGRNLTLKMPEG